MKKLARTLDEGLVAVEKFVLFSLMLALCLTMALQVLSRYLLPDPIAWSEEVSRYLFVWLGMVGASVAMHARHHFGIEIVVDVLPPRLQALAAVLAELVIAATCITFAIQGWRFVSINAFNTGPASGIPLPWVTAAVPAGMVLIVVHLALGALYRPLGRKTHD